MADLIDRQAAIDAVRSYYDEFDEREESIEERIEQLPSAQQCEYWDSESNHCALYRPSAQPADAVEVVRCKDCYHYNEEHEQCLLNDSDFKPTDYCSYGSK